MAIDGYFRDPWVLPYFPPITAPESRFDNLEGETRLRALQDALSSETTEFEAADWLRQSDHAVHILGELEAAASLVDCFPHLWECFGHTHFRHGSQPESEATRDTHSEAVGVLGLMSRLSDATVETAIGGISLWLHMWSEHVIGSELGRKVWLRAWPAAVKVTNAAETGVDKGSADASVRQDDEWRTLREIDAFHLPVGKLLRVFLELFRFTDEIRDPFSEASLLTQMRDRAMDAPGRSGLIAHCQFTQKLPDFLQIDTAWAMQRLVDPLLNDDDRSVPLWRAVALTWIEI